MSALMERAYRALETARLNARESDTVAATNRAYFAAFDAVRAALAAEGNETYPVARTHTGVENRFGRLFVVTGRVDRSIGRAFSRLMEARWRADYSSDDVITPEDAAASIADAELVIAACAALIESEP